MSASDEMALRAFYLFARAHDHSGLKVSLRFSSADQLWSVSIVDFCDVPPVKGTTLAEAVTRAIANNVEYEEEWAEMGAHEDDDGWTDESRERVAVLRAAIECLRAA